MSILALFSIVGEYYSMQIKEKHRVGVTGKSIVQRELRDGRQEPKNGPGNRESGAGKKNPSIR
jgi:hypothetical protein